MKYLIITLTAFLIFTSCDYNHVQGSGNIVSETRKVTDFTEISVSGAFDVEVKIGPVTQLVVEADDNVIKYIETIVSGNTLKIRTEENHGFSNTHRKIFVTVPALTSVRAAASADLIVKGIVAGSDKLYFKASSSADIKAEVDAPEVVAEASSSASIILSGRTRSYNATASSSSEIKTWDLLAENTTVKASSSATARVHASVSLDARASSSADIVYHGAAAVNKSVSSSGSVVKKD